MLSTFDGSLRAQVNRRICHNLVRRERNIEKNTYTRVYTEWEWKREKIHIYQHIFFFWKMLERERERLKKALIHIYSDLHDIISSMINIYTNDSSFTNVRFSRNM